MLLSLLCSLTLALPFGCDGAAARDGSDGMSLPLDVPTLCRRRRSQKRPKGELESQWSSTTRL